MMRVVRFPQQDYCPVKREIHPHLAAMVCASAFVLGVSSFVFTGAPFSFMIDGRLAYISEGFEKYCGWAGAILGSAGGITMLGQLVVSAHIDSTAATWATLVQFVSWNLILGVANTGWALHYVSLCLFFVATVTFHRLASTNHPYATAVYQQLNGITIMLLPVFGGLFCAAACVPGHRAGIITATVTLEYIITLLAVGQMLCLGYGLASLCTLTLIFEASINY